MVDAVDGLTNPQDAIQGQLWWALRGRLKLAGCAKPDSTFDFPAAFAEGLTQAVSLLGPTDIDYHPLVATTFELQDLFGQVAPADAELEWDRVMAAATEVRRLLDNGEGVLVHCLGGTGRTGAVVGAVLASYGMALDEVACWLDDVHQRRGTSGWPECPWQRDALAVLQDAEQQPRHN